MVSHVKYRELLEAFQLPPDIICWPCAEGSPDDSILGKHLILLAKRGLAQEEKAIAMRIEAWEEQMHVKYLTKLRKKGKLSELMNCVRNAPPKRECPIPAQRFAEERRSLLQGPSEEKQKEMDKQSVANLVVYLIQETQTHFVIKLLN